jgi:hypothetical protein
MFRRVLAIGAAAAFLTLCAFAGGVDKENLKDYGRGIIKDYSDMKESDEIEWVWLQQGMRLSDHRLAVRSFENLTAVADEDMEQVLEKGLSKALGSKDPAAPVLHVESAVYWAQRASRSKRWIPYAGGHLAQAGVGIELVFLDEGGAIVCKVRHSGREGDQLQDAAEELIDDVRRFIRESDSAETP